MTSSMSAAIRDAIARRGEDRDAAREALAQRLGLAPVDEPEVEADDDDTDKPVSP